MMPARPANIENRIWSCDEIMPRADLRALQLARLRDTVARTANVPFYRDAFRATGVTTETIKSLDDIRRLPFTTKDDLRRHYPFGLFAVPRQQLARIHCSSGTTGVPTVVGYTADDLEMWSNLCARFLVAGGLQPRQLVHIAFGYGMFTGGFGLHYGVEKIGAATVPAASGNTSRHILFLKDFQPDALVCTPSYALQIAEKAHAEGFDPRAFSLKLGFFGAEPWTENMRVEIEAQLGLLAFNNYGLSEVMGPGVSGECNQRNGMHIQEDHFIVECLDPHTLEPVPPGARGELVFTTLTKQAIPLLRYRTRDLAALDTAPCPCGRTGALMSRIVGRTDDMLIVRGVNVFPSQIEEALLKVEGTAPHYLIEVDRPGSLDELTVRVEMREAFFSDKIAQLNGLREKIDKAIQSITGIRAKVELVRPKTIERSAGKAVRVLDKRRLKDN